ncbi:MAG: colicin V production protein [Crocinitomicaceae bacterium]|nr:colicin V production protein [Crocinitomicaceae bacterium]|tara:strand:- start:1989 stop:2519 length:531 start_codon:yes stop_codon:yes gene_type:complete
MNVLDIIIIIPLLYGGFKGFTRGFIIEITSIAGLVLGIYCGIYFSDYAADFISQYFELGSSVLQFASFITTFVVIVMGIHLIGKALEKAANLVALKLVNKLFGAGFGILKFSIIVSVLVVVVDSIDQRFGFIPSESKNESKLYAPLASITPTLVPAIKNTEWYIDQLQEEILDQAI